MKLSALQDIAEDRNTPRALHLRHPVGKHLLWSGPKADPISGQLEDGADESGHKAVEVDVLSAKSELALKFMDARNREAYIRVNGSRTRDVAKEAEQESVLKMRSDARALAARLITAIRGVTDADGNDLSGGSEQDKLALVSIHEDFCRQICEFAEADSNYFASASSDTD